MVFNVLLLESSALANSVGWSGARSSAQWDHHHACLHQRRSHTLLCGGSPWLWPLSAERTCTRPFSLNPPHANLDMAHPKTLPFFLSTICSFCVYGSWLVGVFVGSSACVSVRRRPTDTACSCWLTCLGETIFLQWLQYDACNSRKSGEIKGLFRCFYSVCTFAFGNRFDRKDWVCTYLKIILLRIQSILFCTFSCLDLTVTLWGSDLSLYYRRVNSLRVGK